MKRILIMHQTITGHDAIGNDIACMYDILKEKFSCKCYAENCFNQKLIYAEKEEALDIIEDEESIVIYHHSVNWTVGEELIKNIKATLIFRYHNITPPEFFEPYNNDYFVSCKAGREQTDRLIKTFPQAYWLSDSLYNNEDLVSVEEEKLFVCPPFHKIEEWSGKKPDEEVLKKLIYDKQHKVLFVGRVAPNKGHLMLFDVLYAYCNNFGRNIKLYIIGKFDEGLSPYNDLVRQKIAKYRLQNQVEFVGEINDSILMSYYLGCDVFLCTSDHEGFCVPIIEAQNFQLPIVAKKSCAVPETIGENQILLEDDVKEYAAAMKLLLDNKNVRDYIRENGSKNFSQRFTYQEIERLFKTFFEEKIGGEV